MGILDTFRSWLTPSPSRAPAASPSDDIERALARAGYDPDQAKSLGDELSRSVGGYMLPRRGTAELLSAYATTPWLHAVTRRRAEALSAVEWVLYKPGKGESGRASRMQGMRSAPSLRHEFATSHVAAKRLVQVGDHPLLDLLEHPTEMAPGPLFWELLSKWGDLAGEQPQAMVFDDNEVVELTPILPTLITKVATSDKPWFEVRRPLGASTFAVPQEDMIWVHEHDPASPYTGRGIGTGAVLADELETDEYMAIMAKSLFYNHGSPKAFVGILPSSTGTAIDNDALKALSASIESKHGGVRKAGQLHLINRDIRVATVGQTLVENQYIDGRRFLRDTCMQIFGCPPEILGVLTSSNRSTIDAADYLFAKFSTQPALERLRAFYQAQLVPEFGDDLVLDYVSPIPANKEFKKSVMVALPAAFSINQVLTLAGEATLGPAGDRPYPAATGNVPTSGAPKKEPENAVDA